MNKPRRTFLSALLIALLTAVSPAASEAERGLKVGELFPPREVKLLDRARTQLPSQEGLTVLLFWSTWSPRSKSALDLWKGYQEDYRANGVHVVTVNADHQQMTEQDIAVVTAYIAQNAVTLPVYLDDNLDLFNEIGVIVLPTVFFLKGDGTIIYKYPGLPSSAALDIKEDLEKTLGIAREPEVREARAPTYQPANNALLYFNLGKQFHLKGSLTTAEGRYLEALKRDPAYPDPLRGLEGIYFKDGRTPEAEKALADLLISKDLEPLVEHVGEGEPLIFEVEKKTDPKLRLKQLMEKNKADGGH